MDSLIQMITTDWKDILLAYPQLKDIETFLSSERDVYGDSVPTFPSPEHIFRCFNYCNISDIKVVILGQDPYHGDGQAIGLCFGVNERPPPSLKNIQKELLSDTGNKMTDVSLEAWATQGVLLLNTALTVRRKTPASHMKIWLPFTKYIIDYLNKTQERIIFVAWGAFAYNKLQNIDKDKHGLIVSSHPSPFSAHRPFKQFPAFLGSRPFSKINEWLTSSSKIEFK